MKHKRAAVKQALFRAPDRVPYEVVYNTLVKMCKNVGKKGGQVKIRPYLQDFTAKYIKDRRYFQEYGPEQIRQQIKAVKDAGLEEWILWNPRNVYSEEALEKEELFSILQ